MIQREIQSSLQVLIDTSLVAVRKRDHLIEERDISGLGDILVDRGEEPERVIRAVGRVPGRTDIAVVLRCILMSRIVVELDQRKSAAVMDLSRKHEPDLVSCFFRRQMNDSLDILYRIAVTVAVPKTAVEEGGCSGPCKCHKAVICVPCVDHGVELRTGCFDLKVREPLTPHALQHFDFLLTDFFRRSVVLHDLPALLIILLSEDECNRSALPGLKTEDRRQSPDAVPVVSHTSSEISIDHTDRIPVRMVISEKCIPFAAAGRNLCTGKSEEAFRDTLIADCHISLIVREISVDLLTDPILGKQRPRDEHRVLEIDLVLLVIAMIRELTGPRDRELSLHIRVIAYSEHPDLITHTVRNIIDRLAVDPLIVRVKYRITRPVAAHALICVRIFADRLPGS